MTDLYDNYKKIGELDETCYNETASAEPTSRVLDGSSDHGYACEYIGYGEINGQQVKAIYLFDDEDLLDGNGDQIEDEGSYDWPNALKRFELVD
jgi:hypothetical protein